MPGEVGRGSEGVGDLIPTDLPRDEIALQMDWDILLDEIEEGEVIPIIGQDFLSEQVDGETFDAGFAGRLAGLLGLNMDGEVPSVASVAAQYARSRQPRGKFRDSMEWLVRDEAEGTRPESLGKLARIPRFRVFVTTTFDHWMEQALRAAGRTAVSLAYEPGEHGGDLPEDWVHRDDAFVYHLLGRPGASAFAVFEDDILEFMHQLLSPASPRRPEQLFDALEKSHLLFLGCRFPDWLTRFFVRMARGVRLDDSNGRRNWIVGGTVEGDAGQGLKQFLAMSDQTTVFKDLSTSEFVAQLLEKWEKRHPPGKVEEVAVQAEASQKVFLSYASEDREALVELCRKLDEKKVLYWFDRKELKPGDDWDEKIKRNVRECCLFIPLISKHLTTSKRRYFRLEWEEAIKQQVMAGNTRYMIPVLLEGADWDLARHEQIALGVQERNWMEMSDFLDQIVDFYRDAQRARLDGKGGS